MMLKSKKKKLKEECWNIDYEFLKWLNIHLRTYIEDASKIVDLEYKEYEYNGITYTQKGIMERMIELTDKLTNEYFVPNDDYEMIYEVLDLFKIVFVDLWW